MGVQFVTGKLGGGKGKYAVMKLLEAAKENRRISGNVDLNLAEFSKKTAKTRYIRVPDKPNAFDLEALGHGNPESYDEDRNGLLVLDELGTWFNSRSFQDKERAGVLDWMIHARKHGWDVILICQNEVQIDKQAREALGEVFVRCMAMHKVKIPVVGALLTLLTLGLAPEKWLRLPRFHVASVRVGTGGSSFVSERIAYRGDHLHAMYDTRQIFKADPEQRTRSELSPLYFTGLPAKKKNPFTLLFRVVIGERGAGMRSVPEPRLPRITPREWPDHIAQLPPDKRWQLARRMFPVTPWQPAPIDRNASADPA
jgi:hypothetical protein